MKKIIACAFAGVLSFAACETTMGMLRDNVINNIPPSYEEQTLLHRNVEPGHECIFGLPLSFPSCNVNAKDKDGNTPLHMAVKKKNTEIVRLLLARQDIHPNERDNFCRSALHYAVDEENTDEKAIQIAALLIGDKRVYVNGYPHPLSIAISHLNMSIIEALLARPDLCLDDKQSNIMPSALNTGNRDIIQLLISDEKYGGEARFEALRSIARDYNNSWEEELVLMVLNDPNVDLNELSAPWGCPPFVLIVLAYRHNLKLFKLILQNLKIDLNKKFSNRMLCLKDVSPFEFLISEFNGDEKSIIIRIENLCRLFLFRKIAPQAMLSKGELLQLVKKKHPDWWSYKELWDNVIGIAYGDKSEFLIFSLLGDSYCEFNASDETRSFYFGFLKNLFENLTLLKEFAPPQEKLQQWMCEKCLEFAADPEECQRVFLDKLYGPQQD